MTIDEFVEKVSAFRSGHLPGRNVYLWCGSADDMEKSIGIDRVNRIDLLDLFLKDPIDDGDTRKVGLDNRLREWLNGVLDARPVRSIALIEGLEIGAFYKMDLHGIYNLHADERRMTILCSEETEGLRPILPQTMSYDPMAVRQFYRGMIANHDKIVEAVENGSNPD